MKKFRLLVILSFLMTAIGASAQTEVYQSLNGPLQPLHVDGNNLKDPFGNKVVLHGVMDTPSPYFNNNRWGNSCSSVQDAKKAVVYFDKLFTAITDSTKGAYCNLFRLHLDPCWLGRSSTLAAGFTQKDGKTYDPHGNEVSGEANISKFSKSHLTAFLKNLYVPIALKALAHGLYVIMRPPGVFPGYVEVDDYYNDYIMTVWDIVTQNDSIKKYAGQIMIELGNEPVTLRAKGGAESEEALHDFFQPVVEKMRSNGYEGVIWVPGTGWQGNYRNFAKYGITGDNIGYAVHNYVGWYGGNDKEFSIWGAGTYPINSAQGMEAYSEEFRASCPIMGTNPIVITEVDWSPEKEGTGHYNEHGDWVLSNYGTWATGTTSGWGAAYKYTLDKFGNISMTLSGTGCYIDIDSYIKNNKYNVVPAFKTAMEANGLDPHDASGVACFEWYADYFTRNYSASERYQPLQVVPENPFEFDSECYNPNILYVNTTKSTSSYKANIAMKNGGFAGWRFEEKEGIDISGCKYIVITFLRSPSAQVEFRLYDSANYWDEPYVVQLKGKKEVKIDLEAIQTASGKTLDLSRIRLAGFQSGADQSLYVKDVFASVDGETPATAIGSIASDNALQGGQHYSVGGQMIPASQSGMHIIRYKDGSVRKVIK